MTSRQKSPYGSHGNPAESSGFQLAVTYYFDYELETLNFRPVEQHQKKFPQWPERSACMCVCGIVWSVLERPLEKAVTFAKGTGVRSYLPMAPHCESIKLPPSDLKPSSLLHKGHLYRYPSAIPLFSSTILLFTQDSLPFRDRINSWFCLLCQSCL